MWWSERKSNDFRSAYLITGLEVRTMGKRDRKIDINTRVHYGSVVVAAFRGRRKIPQRRFIEITLEVALCGAMSTTCAEYATHIYTRALIKMTQNLLNFTHLL